MANSPFLLRPAAKDYLWGGSRLNDDFNKKIDMSPLAETWECSTHSDGLSMIGSGEYEGKSLLYVLKKHPEYLGTHPLMVTEGRPELPILVKFIDAKKDLSVQVHPDDAFALEFEGSLGKTEMWYVIDAKPGATLVYGFNQDVNERLVRRAIESGRIEKFLNHVQ